MTTPTNEEVRRQFEAWHGNQGFKYVPEQRASGKYVNGQVQGNWLAYQAGYQAAIFSPAVVALVEAVKAVMAHRVGEAPNLGYIRDNAQSRKDIDALRAAIAPFTTGAGHVE